MALESDSPSPSTSSLYLTIKKINIVSLKGVLKSDNLVLTSAWIWEFSGLFPQKASGKLPYFLRGKKI
jgi:hypothetical protein